VGIKGWGMSVNKELSNGCNKENTIQLPACHLSYRKAAAYVALDQGADTACYPFVGLFRVPAVPAAEPDNQPGGEGTFSAVGQPATYTG